MKILVLGWYYSSNLGDAVICDCVAWLLRRQDPQAEVVIRDMAGRTEFPNDMAFSLPAARQNRRRHRLRVLATRLGWDKKLSHEEWCWNRRREAVEKLAREDCDKVVFAGGQLFMDSLALYVEYLTAAFTARGIPVYFNACGTGPSWSRALQRRLGQTLQNPSVKLVSCRDNVALVNRWCGKPIAVPTADPALWTKAVYGISRDPQSAFLGLGIMYAETMPLRGACRFWRRLIRRLEKDGIPWKIFTNGSPGDLALAKQILSTLPEIRNPEERICPPPKTPRELVAAIAQFHSLISFRLHSHILACSLDIPTVAVTWDRKLPLFFDKIGHPERCLTVAARPGKVLRTLDRAGKTGYNRERRNGLRENAAALLCTALEPESSAKRGAL